MDYNLKVHYHPGKVNVVVDTLSQKSHYNSLLEDGFNLLHPGVLHNITISCSLKSKIIELQKTDVGVFHIKIKMKNKTPNILDWMRGVCYGLKIDW
jgi:hypothetical protein